MESSYEVIWSAGAMRGAVAGDMSESRLKPWDLAMQAVFRELYNQVLQSICCVGTTVHYVDLEVCFRGPPEDSSEQSRQRIRKCWPRARIVVERVTDRCSPTLRFMPTTGPIDLPWEEGPDHTRRV